ncbi:hypothetical protein BGX24_011902 [Mortierella sp. AD032]|nr:hypothetical protein BGX24_011902 [Mortierella sp. AD032]
MVCVDTIEYIVDDEYIVTGKGLSVNDTFILPTRQRSGFPFCREWLVSIRPQTSSRLSTGFRTIKAAEIAAAATGNEYGLYGTHIWITGMKSEIVEERGGNVRVVGEHIIEDDLLFAPREMSRR